VIAKSRLRRPVRKGGCAACISNAPGGRNQIGPLHAWRKLAKRVRVARFVFASSCGNYGQAGETMIDETGELNPQATMDARMGAEQLYNSKDRDISGLVTSRS